MAHSRRAFLKVASLAPAAAAAARAVAQAPAADFAPAPPTAGDAGPAAPDPDPYKVIREFPVPLEVEPAFLFRAADKGR